MCLILTCDWHLWYNKLSDLEKEEIAENCTQNPRPDLKCSLSCHYCQIDIRPTEGSHYSPPTLIRGVSLTSPICKRVERIAMIQLTLSILEVQILLELILAQQGKLERQQDHRHEQELKKLTELARLLSTKER